MSIVDAATDQTNKLKRVYQAKGIQSCQLSS